MSIISVKNLRKEFSLSKRSKGLMGSIKSLFKRDVIIKQALQNVSFEIDEGELVGYIGPNGAGKSTTVKILSGILLPTMGSVEVLGKTPWKHRIEIVKQLGVVFGQRTQLWWDLPVIDSFELLQAIYGISHAEYRRNLDFLVATLELSKLLEIPVRQLSLGQRMRCDIAASLLHSPKIVFLDEPTIGLDAVSKLATRDFIRLLNKEKKTTIILTTHDMDDIESLCERVIVLNEGKVFEDGSLEKLRRKIAPDRRLIIDLINEHDHVELSKASLVKKEGHRAWISFNPTQTSAPDLIKEIASKYAIRDLFVENPPIEEIIAQFYRDVNL